MLCLNDGYKMIKKKKRGFLASIIKKRIDSNNLHLIKIMYTMSSVEPTNTILLCIAH